MTEQSGGFGRTRRNFLAGAGAVGLAAVAGCSGNGGGDGTTTSESGGPEPPQELNAGGSSTVYPILDEAQKYWNGNPEAGGEYWKPGDYGIDTDQRLADYWVSQYGFEGTGSGDPLYGVSVKLSHSDVGLKNLMEGKLDIGDASAPVKAELSDLDEATYEKFTNHVVGIDAMQMIVSKAVRDAGVTRLTKEQVAAIYTGEITDWSQIDAYDGPDKEIQCVGRVQGSGTRTIFHLNILGSAGAKAGGVDTHQSENQQVESAVANSDNAVGYVGLAFTDNEAAPTVELEVDGTVYSRANGNLQTGDYPLNRDLHCYTWEGTSRAEASFLAMVLSDYGQATFVEPNDYLPLPDDRQRAQLQQLESLQD
ncbi:MAG: PstS family phosphate ABC transporter substrate-binding protein [Halobacteriaceae archaeon]